MSFKGKKRKTVEETKKSASLFIYLTFEILSFMKLTQLARLTVFKKRIRTRTRTYSKNQRIRGGRFKKQT